MEGREEAERIAITRDAQSFYDPLGVFLWSYWNELKEERSTRSNKYSGRRPIR